MTKAIYGARLPRLAAGVSLGLLMAASGYSAAAAGEVTPSSVNGVQHFFDCFGVLLHDGQAHQQYCSPGNAAGPGNSSLGSFSGGAEPACSIGPFVMLERSFSGVDVASLTPDFYIDAPTLTAPKFRQAQEECCDASSIGVPLNVNVASLAPDFYGDPSAVKGLAPTRVAVGCCLQQPTGSLNAPAFLTYQTASLDDSIGSELQTIGNKNMQLATPCP
jgi:hypothetical protein